MPDDDTLKRIETAVRELSEALHALVNRLSLNDQTVESILKIIEADGGLQVRLTKIVMQLERLEKETERSQAALTGTVGKWQDRAYDLVVKFLPWAVAAAISYGALRK